MSKNIVFHQNARSYINRSTVEHDYKKKKKKIGDFRLGVVVYVLRNRHVVDGGSHFT